MNVQATTNETFPYLGHAVPAGYACAGCRVTGCKLWREWHPSMPRPFLCASCACRNQSTDVASLDDRGIRPDPDGLPTDWIGACVPAIPIDGDIRRCWGHGQAPADHYAWWSALPIRPS